MSSYVTTFDREVKDLVYRYKALFGYVNVDVSITMSRLSVTVELG